MKLTTSILIACLLAAPVHGEEALFVVVNAGSEVAELSHHELVDIFMGRYNTFPDGAQVTVFDNDSVQGLRERFYRQLVDRSLAQVDSYWARLQFSGRVTQPEELGSAAQLQEKMRTTRSAITFVSEGQLNDSLKVVHRFDP
ncbi:hypothetical protein KJI95_06855 [Shewanella sp. JM162201]|uniref:Phosphate ABC transporter substrate-binding protein n=1 Tax=Shewanella jiangmenensis TaxID=2837387 RepID=A0ABS5V199_9GAMM|nr:hypothetical protein [Shewanella jiangmenensis]MBT1444243.1 hypothetical protein [Shewanella jiangmenensis]